MNLIDNHNRSDDDIYKPAIVFDFGGVLIDWNPYYLFRPYFQNDDQAVERFLKEVRFREFNDQKDRGRPYQEIYVELCQRHPHYQELFEAFDTHWIKTVGGPIQGTVDILHDLKSEGYACYGLSNWSADKFALVQPRYDFFRFLDLIIISGLEGVAKPDERIFEILLERTGRQAAECLFVDDSLTNVAAAEKMGFQVIHFQNPEQLRSELERLKLLV